MPTSSVTFSAAFSTAATPASSSAEGTVCEAGSTKRGPGVPCGTSSPPTSPGIDSTATPRSAKAALTACSINPGACSAVIMVARKTATSANTESLSTSWKKSLPISSRGTWPQIASTGTRDFAAS